jgi:EAL domain-containing protein (putative c-di-GMP-specific phosphodiesterase class I)
MKNNIIFQITEEDLQGEAMKRIGRRLNEEEIDIAIDAFEWGLCTCAVADIYNTIFTGMI